MAQKMRNWMVADPAALNKCVPVLANNDRRAPHGDARTTARRAIALPDRWRD